MDITEHASPSDRLEGMVKTLEALLYGFMAAPPPLRNPVWIDVVRHEVSERPSCPRIPAWANDPGRLSLVARIVPDIQVFHDHLTKTDTLPYVEEPRPLLCPECGTEMRGVNRWLFWNTPFEKTPRADGERYSAILVGPPLCRYILTAGDDEPRVECSPALRVHSFAAYAAQADQTPTEERVYD